MTTGTHPAMESRPPRSQGRVERQHKGPSKSRGSETRERLLQAAQELFAQDSYAGTSIGGVAQRAGVGVGTVYHHFADKRTIFLELLKRHEAVQLVDEVGGPIARVLAEDDARAALEELIKVWGSRLEKNPMIHQLAPELVRRDPEIAERCERIARGRRRMLQHDIEAAQRTGKVRSDVNAAASAFWVQRMIQIATTSAALAVRPEDLDPLLSEFSGIICGHLLSQA